MKKLFNIQKGIFFWKKKSEPQKAEEMLQLYIKYIPQIRKIMNDSNEQTDGDMVGKMYDFYKSVENGTLVTPWMDREQMVDNRKEAKPISVVVELETVPTPFSLEDLDEKISSLKDKKSLVGQRYAKEQIQGLCNRLENRKKYEKYADFYSAFPNTTDDKIDKLLANYKLKMDTSDLFIPTFPKDAIDVMKKYTEVTKKVCGETPVYYVIAEEKDFAKKREKLDPILLVQSPFGFYWQILGAWDKEMLLLSEL